MGESMDDLAALLFRERCFILDGLMTFSCERVADVFDLVVKLTTAVIALARVALGILVGQPTAGRVHHCGGDMILAGDQFKRARLTVGFLGHERSDVRILCGDKVHQLAGHGIKRGGRGER